MEGGMKEQFLQLIKDLKSLDVSANVAAQVAANVINVIAEHDGQLRANKVGVSDTIQISRKVAEEWLKEPLWWKAMLREVQLALSKEV
jgi:capsid protein